MGRGATNKRKGSNAERYYAQIFRDLGFDFCETSRFVSKKHDNAKIDLMYIPFNIQVKAGVQKNMNPGKELFLMESSINSMFPPEDEVFTKPCLLFHYKQGVRGKKRTEQDEIVYMSENQFNLFNQQIKDLEHTDKKSFKFDLNSQFKHIVWMTFDYFNKKIIKTLYNGRNNKE